MSVRRELLNPDKGMRLRQEYIADTNPFDLNSVLSIIDLVDGEYLTIIVYESMLNVDPTGTGPGKISDQ